MSHSAKLKEVMGMNNNEELITGKKKTKKKREKGIRKGTAESGSKKQVTAFLISPFGSDSLHGRALLHTISIV